MIRYATMLVTAALMTLTLATASYAERLPVLKQIDVPHDYYFREMYLPQLTTGPSSLSWSPDGRELVYSMEGSLWRQQLGTTVAQQLTAGPGYDYQPDWSPDGNYVVFVRYANDTLNLQLLDLTTGQVTPLTGADNSVNVEPRWSPDGSRIAYVSTEETGRFHILVGELDIDRGIFDTARLVEERESEVERYYYSSFDHQLSPSWSPDGSEILYVSNPETPYGSGSIWARSLADDAAPRLVREEETSWKARPDWSPDSNRIVYASYLGRQWHQLWTTTTDNAAEPFPLTYGDFDVTAPRWSRDASRIAYIVNQSGNTEIRFQDVVGGRTDVLSVTERRYLQPMVAVRLEVVDQNGMATPARIAVVGADGRSYAPQDVWMHADDSFDRAHSSYEAQYFHSDGTATLMLPVGTVTVTVWHGPEYQIERQLLSITGTSDPRIVIPLHRLDLPKAWDDWVSGDVHVHMNYGGTYRATPQTLAAQARAEDLGVVFNLIVNKEQRIPDIAYFSSKPDTASDKDVLLLHSQEFHTSFWGHLGLLGLDSHLLIPDYSGYPGTAAASLFPDNTTVAKLAHEQNALVGYVHPFLAPPPNPKTDEKLTNALPVDVALGLVDYYEVVGFADHRTSAKVWYGLLNCGFRVAAAGGTDAMTNYASLRGPVGVNRSYVHVAGEDRTDVGRRNEWLGGLRSSRSIATNGPLLGLSVDGHGPGAEIALKKGTHELQIEAYLRSAVDVDHLEVVHNGKVIRTVNLKTDRRTADLKTSVEIDGSGWLLLRAWNESSDPLVFDLYPYATTSPIFVTVDDKPVRSRTDAEYFIAWIKRIRESVESHPDFNNDAERDLILANLNAAAKVYEACR